MSSYDVREFIDLGSIATLKCPYDCDAVPHITGTSKNVQRYRLKIHCSCEEGHLWNIVFDDHSGSTSLLVEKCGMGIEDISYPDFAPSS
jgi:hypothetical protein